MAIRKTRWASYALILLIVIIVLGISGFLITSRISNAGTQATICSLISIFVLMLGLIIAFVEIRAVISNQTVSILNNLDSTWMSDTMNEGRIEFHKLTGKWEKDHKKDPKWIKEQLIQMFEKSPAEYNKISRLLNFFEGLAHSVKSNYLGFEDVFGIYSPAIRQCYDVFKDFIVYRQAKENDPYI